MKKKLLLSLLLASITLTQTASAQSIYYGAKAGLNITKLSQTSDAYNRQRGAMGLFAGYKLNNITAIQVETIYSWQGTIDKSSGYNSDISLNYLKVPVMGKFLLLKRFRAEAGLSFNFLMSAQQDGARLRNMNGFDLSIPLGVSYEIIERVELGLRYDFGLIDVSLDDTQTSTTNNWLFSLAYRF